MASLSEGVVKGKESVEKVMGASFLSEWESIRGIGGGLDQRRGHLSL